jgi:hypothetical protein
MHLAHEDAESIWNQCCYCWWWSWKGGRVGEQENADDEMMMSYHSDEYMHCYFRDVSINIRRKWGKNMETSCIAGMVCGDSLMKTRHVFVFIWLSFIFSNSICIVVFSSFPDLQILSHWCLGGSGGNGVWGEFLTRSKRRLQKCYLIHAWVWKTGFE